MKWKMATRTYNGVPKREYLVLWKLEKELYDEWKTNPSDTDAHNRLRGILNVISMYFGHEATLDLRTE